MSKTYRLAGVFFLLVIFPALSWLYLRQGLDYRIQIKDEIQQFSNLDQLDLRTADGIVVDSLFLKEHYSVWIPKNSDTSAGLDNLEKLLAQFQHRNDVAFLFTTNQETAVGIPAPFDTSIISFEVPLSVERYDALWSTIGTPVYEGDRQHIPDSISHGGQRNAQRYLALSDTKPVVVNYYDYAENPRMGRLVEHLAILLPTRSNPKPVLRRETEK